MKNLQDHQRRLLVTRPTKVGARNRSSRRGAPPISPPLAQLFLLIAIVLTLVVSLPGPLLSYSLPTQTPSSGAHRSLDIGYEHLLNPSNASLNTNEAKHNERRLAQSRNYVINNNENNVAPRAVTVEARVETESSGGQQQQQHSDVTNHASLNQRHPQWQVLFSRLARHQQQQPDMFATKHVSNYDQDSSNENKVVSVEMFSPKDSGHVIEGGTELTDSDEDDDDDGGNQSTNQSNPPVASLNSRILATTTMTATANSDPPASRRQFSSHWPAHGGEKSAQKLDRMIWSKRCEDQMNMTNRERVPCRNFGSGITVGRSHVDPLVKESALPNKSRAQHVNSTLSALNRDETSANEEMRVINDDDDLIVSRFDVIADPNDHRFSECDEMFLLDDYRPKLSKSSRRRRRSHEQLEELSLPEPLISDKMLQTIYFGGFFPWLADKRTQTYLDAGPGYGSNSGNNYPSNEYRLNNNVQSKRKTKHKNNGYLYHANDMMGSPSADNLQIASHQEKQHQSPPAQPQASTSANTQYTSSETRHQLGKFILPAVRLALDHINTNRSILSAYKLEVVPRDTQVSSVFYLVQIRRFLSLKHNFKV